MGWSLADGRWSLAVGRWPMENVSLNIFFGTKDFLVGLVQPS
jgi:hypothetical protein